jgi:hypothetical protein
MNLEEGWTEEYFLKLLEDISIKKTDRDLSNIVFAVDKVDGVLKKWIDTEQGREYLKDYFNKQTND